MFWPNYVGNIECVKSVLRTHMFASLGAVSDYRLIPEMSRQAPTAVHFIS